MLNQALNKIISEMEQTKNNLYVHMVGEFLLEHLKTTPGSAEKILGEGKTIAKSLDSVRKEAEKKKTGNCAVLPDQEVFTLVLKYFEIDTVVAIQTPAAAPAPKADEFNVNLEDLL